MGAVVRISCQLCGAEWNCNTGCGMLHGTLENVAPLFPKETEDLLMEHIRRNGEPLFDFGFQPAICRSCTHIVSVPVIRLFEDDVTYIGECPECGGKVRLIKNMKKTHCPVCKQGALQTLETGFWD